MNPKSSKAYYRSASALIALERLEEALDCCDRCLAFDAENTGVKALRERALKLKEAKERREREREERLQREREEKLRLRKAFNVSFCLLPTSKVI